MTSADNSMLPYATKSTLKEEKAVGVEEEEEEALLKHLN
jgi:hypothetical protein